MIIEVTIKALVEIPDNSDRDLDQLNRDVENVVAEKFEHFVVIGHKEADEPLS
jgi:hypothetical protein